ncbi:hypothetical protein Esti_004847 [Eimeria stiedai]
MKWSFVPGVRGLLGASCLCAFLASGGVQFASGLEKEETSSSSHYKDSDYDVSRSGISSPDSSERFFGSLADGSRVDDVAGGKGPLLEEQEEERVESEDYETAVSRRARKQTPLTSSSSVLLAKQQLTADEYAQAEAEVQAELEALKRFHGTTTTTPLPGFFKEAALGLRNFVTAPVRAAHAILTRPGESLRSNTGSASLAVSKVKDLAAGKEGSFGELARDWWRMFTMSPDRIKEAKAASRRAALEGSAASRNVMHSDGATAENFGSRLEESRRAERLMQELSESSKSEDQLQREFEERMRRQ